MPASGKFFAAARTFAIDVANGFLAIIHNSFALLGLAVAFMAITLFARPDLRDAGESQLRSWLTARQMAELDRQHNQLGHPLSWTVCSVHPSIKRA